MGAWLFSLGGLLCFITKLRLFHNQSPHTIFQKGTSLRGKNMPTTLNDTTSLGDLITEMGLLPRGVAKSDKWGTYLNDPHTIDASMSLIGVASLYLMERGYFIRANSMISWEIAHWSPSTGFSARGSYLSQIKAVTSALNMLKNNVSTR
jgi:hypothetical protein